MAQDAPRLWSIEAGTAFLPALADALLDGRLIPGFAPGADPLRLADATIYLPTRRAARTLRSVFVERLGGQSAILPSIRPLGEFDEDEALFEPGAADALALAPPIGQMERTLLLAPLVQAWKRRLPSHLAALYEDESIVVPASLADALWLARDLGALMDEIETEGADWAQLGELVPAELAVWWQVTLEFLNIVTRVWPQALLERGRSNPAAHRDAMIRAEAARLARNPPAGPIIAAGSTGSIPATAELLAVIARLANGAVVLPGLDHELDAQAWQAIAAPDAGPAAFGHAQSALRRLLTRLHAVREDVLRLAGPSRPLAARMRLVAEALQPAETTDRWSDLRALCQGAIGDGALDGVTLVEAANEREEALAIAIALRLGVQEEGRHAALVTGDRDLARRVSSELKRFGIEADDSGGTALADMPAATLLRLLIETVMRPGDPVTMVALLKHPMLRLGMARRTVRRAGETIELVALRGATGRPDIADIATDFEIRLRAHDEAIRKPFWLRRLGEDRRAEASAVAAALVDALQPLLACRRIPAIGLGAVARASVEALEALGRGPDGDLAALYDGEDGEALADFLRDLVGTEAELDLAPREWPDVLGALVAGRTVKPSPRGDPRISIWGTLEARLQHVDTLVIGGLNEGSWPRRPEADRFMSRGMKAGLSLEPPERRIGQAAHDFVMALGNDTVVLTRAARSGDAPAVESRWLQRLRTFVGQDAMDDVMERGRALCAYAAALDAAPNTPFAERPEPRPPLALRPHHFSITEIETLRRDPYALFARRILRLQPLDPLLRDPGALERGNLFHDILHHFHESGTDPSAPDAVEILLALGGAEFARTGLPPDVHAVWWPRFARMAQAYMDWERGRSAHVVRRLAEIAAGPTAIDAQGATLRGRADRIDLMRDGRAEIIDFKTGSSPSKGQAHRLISPQLALEGALLARGAFADLPEAPEPGDLVYVRLKSDGAVQPESILRFKQSERSAADLSHEAWERLQELVRHYRVEANGYLSRALPFREGDMSGDYDHLARTQEWMSSSEGEGEDA